MDPSVGRIVHYVARGSRDGKYPSVCRAAIVTAVGPRGGAASLAVLNPTGCFFDFEIAEDQNTKRGGTWHWPETI